MIYLVYVLVIQCCIVTFPIYNAELYKHFDLGRVPSEIFAFILNPFFIEQTQKIYKYISLNDLTVTVHLALKYESVEPIAATEIMRFYHNPINIFNFLEKRPTLLIDILPHKITSSAFRNTLYKQLSSTQNPHSVSMPFSVPATHCTIEHTFTKPLLRIMQNPHTIVIHDEGKSVIVENANMHKITNIPHDLPRPYIVMACGPNPWPLVIKTSQNTIKTLRLEYDTNTIIPYKPSPQDLQILEKKPYPLVQLASSTIVDYIVPKKIFHNIPSVYAPHIQERVWGIVDSKKNLMCIFVNGQERNGIRITPTQLYIYPVIYCSDFVDRLISISLLGLNNKYTPYEKVHHILAILKRAIEQKYKVNTITKESLLYRIAAIESQLQLPLLERIIARNILPIVHTLYNEIIVRQCITLESIDE
jgi:hypothetical protein